MDLLSRGTFVGAGSFCCRNCGYVLTLNGLDTLTDCPGCGGSDFERASLFSAERESAGEQTERHHGGLLAKPAPDDREALLADARASITQAGTR
jgi:predicted  nucleic acid-binding Zn-ribbon protein